MPLLLTEDMDEGHSKSPGHNSDSDVEEIVSQYIEPSKILRGATHNDKVPTTESWLVVITVLGVSAIVTLLFSHDVQHQRFSYVSWYATALVVGYFIIHIQPTNCESVPALSKMSCYASFILTTAMFGMVSFPYWPFLLLWSILGITLYYYEDLKSALWCLRNQMKRPTRRECRSFPLPPPPQIEIKLHAVQQRNKPV